ncbi:palmdelphin-like [Anoplopoma fimbria]|uniref:palmdelphin-like n=1 Tax=Anoplopoma fimbria TaxID=229290 RepID=UPI0023EAB241|nr:palmdelphin-like [Anoplopoma fimbria]
MEESDLLKERLQAITEKHRVQEDIRQRKLELDREKLKLQHLKKKALREQWLLQDASHNAADSQQQQTRALQLNIQRIEMEVEALEREEYMISTNESFILNRLKAVEKSAGDIIKEAQDSFVPEPLLVTTLIPDVPESLSPPANKHFEGNIPRKTLFAMEINVTKNLLTGQSTVLSTATLPPEELNQHAGLKVFDDGRKCVYAFNSQEGSHDQSRVSELSANEVEQLLRSATVHRQVNHQNFHLNHSRSEEHCFYNHQDERDGVERFDPRNQRGYSGSHPLRNTMTEKDFNRGENWQRKPGVDYGHDHQESINRQQEERNNQSNLREGHRLGNHKRLGHQLGNQKDRHYSSYQLRNCHSVQEERPAYHHTSSIVQSTSVVNGGRANDRPHPRSHDQETESAYRSQLCYTPANYIPLSDYISVDREELYGYSPTAVYSGPTNSDRVPSPLCGDDTPYTILNAMETTEPITAIFMGFQTAQDDSGQGHGFEGSLKAELVIIEDNEDFSDDHGTREKKPHSQLGDNGHPTGSSANGNVGRVEGVGDGRAERQMGPGIRKIQKKHKPCCTVC